MSKKWKQKIQQYTMWATHRNQYAMHTSALVSWKISAKVETPIALPINQLTILTSNGLPGFLDKRRRQRVLWTSFSPQMTASIVMMSEKQKPKHFLDKEPFVYRGTWFEIEQETTVIVLVIIRHKIGPKLCVIPVRNRYMSNVLGQDASLDPNRNTVNRTEGATSIGCRPQIITMPFSGDSKLQNSSSLRNVLLWRLCWGNRGCQDTKMDLI